MSDEPTFQVTSAEETSIDACFELHESRRFEIIFHSSGNTDPLTGDRLNREYNLGLGRLLNQLATSGGVITEVSVDSRDALRDYPSLDDRRLDIGCPISLTRVADMDELRKLIGRTAAITARDPEASGHGYPQKRIRISLELPPSVGRRDLLRSLGN